MKIKLILFIYFICFSTKNVFANNMLLGVADIGNAQELVAPYLHKKIGCKYPNIQMEDVDLESIKNKVKADLEYRILTGDYINPNNITTLNDDQIIMYCIENKNFSDSYLENMHKTLGRSVLMLGHLHNDGTPPCTCINF